MPTRHSPRNHSLMSSESHTEQRITPHNFDLDDSFKDTPYGAPRQLANTGRKPSTPPRPSGASHSPERKTVGRTPVVQAKTPSAARRLADSAKRANALTPHTRAAVREVEARRAGLTPRKDRRRSGRQQRETPRDALRALSRTLAPKSQPIATTPQDALGESRRISLAAQEDLEEDLEERRLEVPRLSMALDEDEDDDSLLLPPRSAGLEEENYTVQSVEMPRRAISEQPGGRFSRGSFGSIRMSDHFDNLGMGLDALNGGALDSSFATGHASDNGDTVHNDELDDYYGEDTETLRGLGFNGQAHSTAGRNSDIRPIAPADESEATFVFTVPRMKASEGHEVDGHEAFSDEEQSGAINLGEQDIDDTGDQVPALGLDVYHASPVVDDDRKALRASTLPRKNRIRVSKQGMQYAPIPTGVIKKLATTFARTGGTGKTKIDKDILDVIVQASDWFFEQLSDDLSIYARHAGRKTIDESDVITVMRRQRQMDTTKTAFSLAQKYLPRELLQEMRIHPQNMRKKASSLGPVEEVDKLGQTRSS